MRLCVRFPSEQEKLAREVSALDRASPEERLRVLFELSALCEVIVESSPVRRRQVEVLDSIEEDGHARWREFLAKHATGT